MNYRPHIIIGEETDGAIRSLLAFRQVDHRQHIYVIGKDRIGQDKHCSANWIVQHLASVMGRLDRSARRLAERASPSRPTVRADHLVYFNPGDLDTPLA